jgi:hypothetical protein
MKRSHIEIIFRTAEIYIKVDAFMRNDPDDAIFRDCLKRGREKGPGSPNRQNYNNPSKLAVDNYCWLQERRDTFSNAFQNSAQ